MRAFIPISLGPMPSVSLKESLLLKSLQRVAAFSPRAVLCFGLERPMRGFCAPKASELSRKSRFNLARLARLSPVR